MDTLGQQALELQLERFFTVWAWSWDTEEQPDFGSHLGGSRSTVPNYRFNDVLTLLWVGRPLHPYYKALGSQFEPLDDVLPPHSISFALSPSGLIPSPRFSELSPSPALVQHLRSILPEYVPSVPQPPPDPESDSGSIKAAASTESASGQQPAGGFALPTIPMPAVNLNMDVRNLKWNWPGYLTFGKNSKDKEKQKNAKVTGDEQKKSDTELESKPDTDGEGEASSVTEGEVPGSDPQNEEEKLRLEVEVDTASLADAIESENIRGGSSNEHSPGVSTPSEAPPSPATRTIGPLSDDDATPTAVQPVDPVPVLRGVDETSQQTSSTGRPSPSPKEELPPTVSEPPLPLVTFSQTPVHLAPLEHPLRTTKRRLYYLTVRRPSRAFFSRSELEMCLFGWR